MMGFLFILIKVWYIIYMNQVESLLLKIKEIIKLELIRVSGDALSLESIKINFDIPELTHGDYMTNAAMMYAKELSM